MKLSLLLTLSLLLPRGLLARHTAYSAPYATITLDAAIDGSTAAAKSAVVYQEASGVFTSIGYLKAAAETGDTSIEVSATDFWNF